MISPLRHDYSDLRDVRLHYVTAGQGPAIVLLHGWPQTWFMWRDIIPGLAKKYRVVVSVPGTRVDGRLGRQTSMT